MNSKLLFLVISVPIVVVLVVAGILSFYNGNDIASSTPETNSPVEHPVNKVYPIQDGCYVGGCSSQLCTDQPGTISTCEYKEEYACYKTATCARQPNGQCGWTQTVELTSCLSEK